MLIPTGWLTCSLQDYTQKYTVCHSIHFYIHLGEERQCGAKFLVQVSPHIAALFP